jgi:cyclic beta-1,2-glucan synthetase
VALETLLGFTKRGDTLTFAPVLPNDWPECTVDYRFGDTRYHIRVVRPGTLAATGVDVVLDGQHQADGRVPLTDDGKTHVVEIRPRGGETSPDR